jgi:nifR3 family TIM-barrel protein
MQFVSLFNQKVALAAPGEFNPLNIGPIRVWPPVVLAPMAGVTNSPFRQLCRSYGAGLYVSEMVTAMLLVRENPATLKIAQFAEEERPRSLQLYGVDPYHVGEAVKKLVGEDRVDHIDMNFGCPVRKVTSRGGGAAIPIKRGLLRNIVRAAVRNAAGIPVTIKFRIGINEKYKSFLDSGRIAEDEGCAAVALHARTAEQLYHGEARWDAITQLKQEVRTIPVLGNGDIWEAHDALRMMRETGCDGVVVGRGCLGRPWLFRDLACVFDGREVPKPPTLGEVAQVMLDHARLLCQWFPEIHAMRGFRKHCTWYTKGFRGAHKLVERLMTIESFADLNVALKDINPDEPFPFKNLRTPRGKRRKKQRVSLPAGYLDNLDDDTPPIAAAELAGSGG